MGTPEYTLPQALELFHHIGLDGAEIVVQDGYRCAIPQQADLDELNSLRRQADKLGLRIIALTPYYSRFNDLSSQVREKEIDGLTQVIGYAKVMGAEFIINIILGNTDLTVDDFSPLACALMDPFVLIIGNNENYSTLEEFVAYAKEHPGEIVIGETGTGAAPTLAITAMENALGIDVSNVTYEGSADCVTAIVGGHIDATFAQPSNATAQVEAGNAKIIGTLSNERLPAFPDVPTFAEVFPDEIDYEMMGFCIISSPAGVDPAIQSYLSENLRKGVESESYANTLSSLGMQTENLSPEELSDFLDQQMDLYTDLLSSHS